MKLRTKFLFGLENFNNSTIIVLMLLLPGALCQPINLLSHNQTIVIDPGSKVIMDCKFQADHYDLFEFPILWRKRQISEDEDGGGDGGLQINVMSSINEPFLTTNKYHVGFTSHPPIHNLQLSITNVSVEDSGNYTCELRGPQSNVLHSIRHILFVRVPISTLLISETRSNLNYGDTKGPHNKEPSNGRDQRTPNNDYRQENKLKTLHLEENRFAHVRCDALGGYPLPSLDLFIGKRNISQQFNYKATLAKILGQRGFRRLIFAVERTLHNFLPSGSDDQMTLSCMATVQGLKPVVDSIRLDVDYSPRIQCTAWSNNIGAYYHQSSYEISIIQCQIRAKPHLTTAFWVLDRNGTTLREGEMHPDYWTIRTEQSPNSWRIDLFARQMRTSMFGTYALVAENKVAIERIEVIVSEAMTTTRTTTKTPPRPIMSGNRELQRDLGRRRYVHLRSSGISNSAGSSPILTTKLLIFSSLVPFTSILSFVPLKILLDIFNRYFVESGDQK